MNKYLLRPLKYQKRVMISYMKDGLWDSNAKKGIKYNTKALAI